MGLTSGKVRCAPSSPCWRRSGRCAWLRAAVLLSSPSLRAMADALSGRDRKAGALTEPESRIGEAAAWIAVSRSGLVVTGMALCRGHVFDAAVPMDVVIPMDKIHRPLPRRIKFGETFGRELRPVFGGAEHGFGIRIV